MLFATACIVLSLGAGAARARATEGFGIEEFGFSLNERTGMAATQAGAHPYSMTTTFVFKHHVVTEEKITNGEVVPSDVTIPGLPRELEPNLPRGVVVNPQATSARCTETELQVPGACPTSSAVGYLLAFINGYPYRVPSPIYNMVTPEGVPALFGANLFGLGIVVHIEGKVRSEGDVGLSAISSEIPKTHELYEIQATFWGSPADHSHDTRRGRCAEAFPPEQVTEREKWLEEGAPIPIPELYDFACPAEPDETALLTMPSACPGQPLVASARVLPWDEPAVDAQSAMPAVTGCASLAFSPSIKAQLEKTTPTTPSGLSIDIHIPQNETLGNLAEADMKEATVALPNGLTPNPSTANGREACSSSQIGLLPRSDQRESIVVEPPLTDSFKISLEGQSTASLPAEASAPEVEAALEALPRVGAGNVSVAEVTGGWNVTFDGAFAGRPSPILEDELIDNAVQKLTVTATGGTFELGFKGGEHTSGLPYSANDEEVQKALEKLPAIGEGNVRVVGGPEHGGSTTAIYQVAFVGELADTTVPALEAISALTGPGAGASIVSQPPGATPLAPVTVTEPGGGVRFKDEEAHCPGASEIGTVMVDTPLLGHPLPGTLYLAAQEENPFHSLFAMYLVVDDPVTGIIVKAAGHVEFGERTGQVTTRFEETPELPIENIEVSLFGGERAPLVTPAACGNYNTGASVAPWSGSTPATPSSELAISPCAPASFAPSFTAGTLDNQAGAYGALTISLARDSDQEQQLNGLEAVLPPGLLANLAGVPRCSSANAEAGSCPEESQIGTVAIAAGVGNSPVHVNGKVYLTGPYNGGPFGEVVVVPADAGPFHLGNVVVRGSIRINPTTAQPSIVSDPFPQFIKTSGIPADVREVVVQINRPNFTLNPTNCSAASLTATITPVNGAAVDRSSPFEAANCASLAYKPGLKAYVAGKASKADGASFNVIFTAKGGPATDAEANTRSLRIELPKQLPSRLPTLQRACLAAVFEANPSACPPESDVGTWVARTPLIAEAFVGPSYLVSHGGAAFPDLEIVFQAEGIKVVVDQSIVVKHGITSVTLKTAPDVPLTSVEASFPAGPFSALGTDIPESKHYDLCGQNMSMPTEFTGQTGAFVKQTTKISVTGCPKVKKGKRHRKKRNTKNRHAKKRRNKKK
jgi:hypothetical protein